MTRFLIALGAVAAALAAVLTVGVVPIVSRHDTKFAWRSEARPPRIVLSTDAGDLSCWLHVQLNPIAVASPRFSAQLNGAALEVRATRVARETWSLDVFAAENVRAAAAPVESPQAKFHWLAGHPIVLEAAGGPIAGARITDWTIFDEKDETDSARKAQRRNVLFWALCSVLLVSVVGTAVKSYVDGRREQPSPPLTTEHCVQRIIAAVDGANPAQTQSFRRLLTKVIVEGSTVATALDDLGVHDRRQRFALWFAARSRFRQRLDKLVSELIELQTELGP